MSSAVLSAVESLDFRCRAIDVAEKLGEPIESTHRKLLELASLCDAHVEISRVTVPLPEAPPKAEPGGMRLPSQVPRGGSVELQEMKQPKTDVRYDTLYVFPRHARSVLRQKYWREKVRQVWSKMIWPTLFLVLRASFAFSLVFSIAVLVAAIIVVIVIALSRDNDGGGGGGDIFSADSGWGGGGGGGGGPGPHVIHHHHYHHISFWDWYWTNWLLMDLAEPRNAYYYGQPPPQANAPQGQAIPAAAGQAPPGSGSGSAYDNAPSYPIKPPPFSSSSSSPSDNQGPRPPPPPPPPRRPPGGNDDEDPAGGNNEPVAVDDGSCTTFVNSVFSWLFGDGDPNPQFEARQWQKMADYIRSVGGVVVAPELRPFVMRELPKGDDENAFMMPILHHFDGMAVPSPNGDFMVYHFPSLMPAVQRPQPPTFQEDPVQRLQPVVTYEQEKLWQFSKAPKSSLRNAMWLGAFNLFLLVLFPLLLHWVKVNTQNRGVSQASTPRKGSKMRVKSDAQLVGAFAWWLLQSVDRIYWVLLLYGIAFFVVPFIRKRLIDRWNLDILNRNHIRQQQSNFVMQLCQDPRFRQQISFARHHALEQAQLSERASVQHVYTTRTNRIQEETHLFISSQNNVG